MEENPKVARPGWIISMEDTDLPVCEFGGSLKSDLITFAIGEPVVHVLPGLAEKSQKQSERNITKRPIFSFPYCHSSMA